VYMPGRDMRRIARELREAGVGGDVACAAVSHAATARQSWVASRLDELGELKCGAAPVLLLVGRAMEALVVADVDGVVREVVGAIDELEYFEASGERRDESR
jgi:uroporphyrin-III C-methyltransferase